MYIKQSLTYAQMEHYLKTHVEHSPHTAYANAIRYYMEHNTIGEVASQFPIDLDIVTISDAAFIALCDHLAIHSIVLDDDVCLSSATIFPHNYECFIVRHLNSLNIDMHHHDFYEVCFVWEGGCTHQTSDQVYTMEAGDCLIIPPGIDHKIKIADNDTILFNIMVRASALQSSSFSLLTQRNAVSAFLRHCLLQEGQENCLLIHTDNSVIIRRIIKHLTQECYSDQDIFCDFAINIFNQLFHYIIFLGEVKTKYLDLPENYSPISILQEIQRNYRTITLKSLAAKYFFSEEHLSRLIKKTTGKTFTNLLRKTRIEQAKLLVIRTDLSFEKITELVGYSDASSFTKAFKSSVSLSPAHYRKAGIL